MALALSGCGAVKNIPVQTIEKIEYRDSVVFITDSILVEIPTYIEKTIVPQDTISRIRGKISESTAFVSKGKLHHSLEEKGSIKAKIDTFFKVEYVDRIIEKEIPIEVQVEKRYIPNWCWFALIYAIILSLLIAFKIYLTKFK